MSFRCQKDVRVAWTVCAEDSSATSLYSYGLDKEKYRMTRKIRNEKEIEKGDETANLIWGVELTRTTELGLLTLIADLSSITHTT